jgi:hypothetical protein
MSAMLEKRLEVLIVVVQIVFAAKQGLDDVRVGRLTFFQLLNIGIPA